MKAPASAAALADLAGTLADAGRILWVLPRIELGRHRKGTAPLLEQARARGRARARRPQPACDG